MTASIQLQAARTDLQWQKAASMVEKLIEWDVSQSQMLGFERAEVIAAFYPESMADVRAQNAEPYSQFLLATDSQVPVGCAAFKPLNTAVCELNYVYVRSTHRGQGLGSLLLSRAKAEALAAGYASIYLETATFMHDAHKLYRSHGFELCDHYRALSDRNAIAVLSMRCVLRAAATPNKSLKRAREG